MSILQKTFFLLILLCGFFGLAKNSEAAVCTHYVSPTGSASWANATNISTPTDIVTAFHNATAGNVVCFRGGTYNHNYVQQSDYDQQELQPNHSGTSSNWITFQAYPGETPVINIIGTDNSGTFAGYVASAIGVYLQSYIVFDGLHIINDGGVHHPRIHIGAAAEYDPPHSTGNVIIKNCDINGGSTILPALHDNSEDIRLDSASHVTIQNNRIYNSRTSDDYHNSSAIKTYNTDHTVVKNNEIYNNSNGVYFKRDCQQCEISYNYIHDNYEGGYFQQYNTNWEQADLLVYQNVWANNAYLNMDMDNDQSEGAVSNDWLVYNNTWWNSTGGMSFMGTAQGHGATFYNNIVGASSFLLSGAGSSYLKAEDHNLFNTSSFDIFLRSGGGRTDYYSLASWQASAELDGGGHPGANDSVSAVSFTNGSGNYSLLSDFALQSGSPAKGTGRSGADMGANISLVGIQGGGSSDIVPPASPTGLSVS